jgi:RHS repeat-associated protein
VKVGDVLDFVTQYEYDVLGKTVGIAQGAKRVDYTYNAAGQRMSTSAFAGTSKVFDTVYGYDGTGRLTDLTHANGNKVFADYDFGWDAANRITDFDFSYLGEKDEKTAEYGYGKTSQLIAAEYNTFQPNESYEYDANGNRKKFETGPNNQLTSDGTFNYTYDDEGNRVEKKSLKSSEVTKYVWDHRNRLVQVKTPKEAVNYVYDFRNRLVKRNDEFFIHDEWQIVASLKNNKVTHRYLWGANQDELLATDDAWTLGDHLGSVRDIIDNNGKVVAHREYNAFGRVTRATGKFDCIFGYTGEIFDPAIGLQWNINRWYDAETGRWISEDPIGFLGGGLQLR